MKKIFMMVLILLCSFSYADEEASIKYNYFPLNFGEYSNIRKDIKVFYVEAEKDELAYTIKASGIYNSKDEKISTNQYPIFLISSLRSGFTRNTQEHYMIEKYINGFGYYKNYKFELSEDNFTNGTYPKNTIWSSVEGGDAFDEIRAKVFKDGKFKKQVSTISSCFKRKNLSCLEKNLDVVKIFESLYMITKSNCRVEVDPQSRKTMGTDMPERWRYTSQFQPDEKNAFPYVDTNKMFQFSPDFKYYLLSKDFKKSNYAGIVITKRYCDKIQNDKSILIEYVFGIDLNKKKIIGVLGGFTPWSLLDKFSRNLRVRLTKIYNNEFYLIGSEKDLYETRYNSLLNLNDLILDIEYKNK